LVDTAPDDVAAILFTSGSTGVPKGVVYRHRHFVAQVAMLRDAFGIEAGGVDLPTFPPFALFDPALGLTSIIPDMDPTRPANADPRKLLRAMERFGVTQLFGSPALMRVLAEHGAPLPGVKLATSAGAPVPPGVVARMLELLPDGARFWTPYGATECLPVAAIEGRELLSLRARTEAGAGTCVGRPVAPNEVRIIRIEDDAILEWRDDLLVAPGEVGEITVAGPSATDAYFNRDVQTRLAKIREGDRIVHRMGDLGWFDGEGRLWFCGRKSQRVVVDAATTLCTEQVEPVFNAHPALRRCALVGVGPRGAQRPVLVYELEAGAAGRARFDVPAELRAIAAAHPRLAAIAAFMRYPKPLPVDIRHNAKIGREVLAAWAAKQPLADRA
ncbi:MAG TPA: fatty acid CoA ligase family protein, partial [Luteimonas sp.]|nr:fatty acid CoA ligase family protein [Luteimonas sp.]